MSKVSRKKVAEEAARLLYLGYASNYKGAKEQASKNLNLSFLPSNFEVAEHLDEEGLCFSGVRLLVAAKDSFDLVVLLQSDLLDGIALNIVLRMGKRRGRDEKGEQRMERADHDCLRPCRDGRSLQVRRSRNRAYLAP